MKILYLPGYRYPTSLDEPLTSGDLRYSFTLSRALVKLGHDVRVITRLEDDDIINAKFDGVTVMRYRSELSKIFSTSFDISINRLKLFKKYVNDADLIICNTPLSLEHILKIEAPIVYVASGLEDVKNYSFKPKEIFGYLAIKLLRDPLKRLTWKRSLLVNTTAWYENTTLQNWGIKANKIGQISSSVNTERFQPQTKQAEKMRKHLGFSKKDKVILSVSRFTPAKGILETIKAFSQLNSNSSKLIIIGVHHSHDATYYDRVVQAIASSPRSKDIYMYENIAERDLPAYYSMADATSVFSVGYDPLPTVIIESMACGTPVVSTYYKTREQFITDNKTGVFVEERNLKDWVAKMAQLLDNKALRQQLSNNGLALVRDMFTDEQIAKEFIRKYKDERST